MRNDDCSDTENDDVLKSYLSNLQVRENLAPEVRLQIMQCAQTQARLNEPEQSNQLQKIDAKPGTSFWKWFSTILASFRQPTVWVSCSLAICMMAFIGLFLSHQQTEYMSNQVVDSGPVFEAHVSSKIILGCLMNLTNLIILIKKK